MVSSTTIDRLKAAYRDWNDNKGAAATLFIDLLSDDVNWRSVADGAPRLELAQARSSKDQVRLYFGQLASDWEMIFFSVGRLVVIDETVISVCECCWRHRKTGKIVHSPKLDVVRFKNDKIVAFAEYFDTEQAAAAAVMDPTGPIGSLQVPADPGSNFQTIQGASAVSVENMRVVQSVFREWDRSKGRAIEAIVDVLAPNLHWGSLADGAKGLEFTSPRLTASQVRDYLKTLTAAFEMNYYRVDEYLAAAEFVFAIGECSFVCKATGKTFVTPKADLWRFEAGRAVEFFEYYDTAAVIASTR